MRTSTLRATRAPLVVAAVTLLASLVASAPGVAPAAHAAEDGPDCLPAGGVERPFEAPDDLDTSAYDLLVHGGGFGHGVGMSQYGARGAARAGCTYPTILQTYYPGTRLARWASPGAVRVGLGTAALADVPYRNTLRASGGDDVSWELCDEARTSCAQVAVQDADVEADREWTLSYDTADAAGRWVLRRDGAEIWRGGADNEVVRAHNDGSVVRLPSTAAAYGGSYACGGNPGFCVKWGFTEFELAGDAIRIVQHVTAGTGPDGTQHSAVDRYLWGLSEVPVSWELPAQQAQAVAGRSYALRTIENREGRTNPACNCDLLPTVLNQHWVGWERERVDTEGAWRTAVASTADQVVTVGADAETAEIAATVYSSSHGGFSEDVEHVWGTPFSYLKAVDTSRWECLSDNPLQRWTKGFTADELASRFGMAVVDDVEVVARGPGGRPTTLDVDDDGVRPDGIVVTGRDADDAPVEKRFSSESIRSASGGLGLRSGLVHVEWVGPEPEPSPSPSPTTSPSQSEDTACVLTPEPVRVGGDGRIATAVAASAYGWESADAVVIARADHPADALAGSGLAGSLGAPLLITPTDVLAPAVRDEVNRLGATTAVLLGGEAALGPAVEQGLLDDTTVEDVQRAQGATRIETAVAVGDRLAVTAGGTALLVRGQNAEHPEREWPDALSVAAIAAHQGKAGAAWPILLTGATLPDVTAQALERYGISKVYAIGGPAVVPDEIVTDLRGRGYEVDRIAGSDRWATSRAALAFAVGDEQVLVAATGLNYPDGLAAGPFAAKLGGRLLLVPATYDARSPWLADEHPAAVSALGWDAGQVVIIGGTTAVEPAVGRALRNAM